MRQEHPLNLPHHTDAEACCSLSSEAVDLTPVVMADDSRPESVKSIRHLPAVERLRIVHNYQYQQSASRSMLSERHRNWRNYDNRQNFSLEPSAGIQLLHSILRPLFIMFLLGLFIGAIKCALPNPKMSPFSNSEKTKSDDVPHKLLQRCPTELLHVHAFRNFPATCRKPQPRLAIVAYEGILDAMDECREQMRFRPWDCTRPTSTVLHEPHELRSATRESAYLWAASAAGAAWGVATACAQGWLDECRCVRRPPLPLPPQQQHQLLSATLTNQHKRRFARRHLLPRMPALVLHNGGNSAAEEWEWSGCKYGVQYGVIASRKLLTRTNTSGRGVRHYYGSGGYYASGSGQTSSKILRKLEKHNLKTGRMALKKTLISSCKCHGVSGSCQQRTCWRKTADLTSIMRHLTEKYERARQLDAYDLPTSKNSELVYVEESPDLCSQLRYDVYMPPSSDADDSDKTADTNDDHLLPSSVQQQRKRDASSATAVASVQPRICSWRNETHSEGDCDNLCCGQGYTVTHEVSTYKCDCKFVWCCRVECNECLQHRWVSTCNTDT